MLHNKKGAALLQVLLVSAVLAGMATMLLRASLGRTSTSRHARRPIAAEALIERCQAEVEFIWASKSRVAFEYDLLGCFMMCNSRAADGTCLSGTHQYPCEEYPIDWDGDGAPDITYTVMATMGNTPVDGLCPITYELTDDTGNREVTL